MSVSNEVIEKISNIRPLSDSAIRLMQTVSNRNHGMADVVAIVETDPVLTGRLLSCVNSAAYGLSEPVESVNRSIAFLGERMVLGIALEVCAGDLYDLPLEGYCATRGQLWTHCLQTAIAAREIGRWVKGGDGEMEVAYTAGLLHDIGKAVINEWLKGCSHEMVHQLESGPVDFPELERKILHTDHTEVGSLLLEKWGVPESLRMAVRYHHEPARAPDAWQALAYVVHLADFVSMMSGGGTGMDSLQYSLDSNYTRYIQTDVKRVERLCIDVEQEYEKVSRALENAGGGE